jgi:TolB-like protein/Flp pilus assembly protein TadD
MGTKIAELVRRGVPQVLGVYLAASWGLLEFTDWAVVRFSLARDWTTGVLAVLAASLPLVLWAAWRLGGRGPSLPQVDAPPRSVAVLPFANLGGDADTGYLGFGIADQILNHLTKIGDLNVVARTSSFAYEDVADDMRSIGRRLGVRALLEGSVQRVGNRLRITTQLVKTSDGYHLWSERYDRPMEDVFAIQDEIASSVARALNAILRDEERKALGKVPTQEVQAYEIYLRGRQFMAQSRRKSLEYARDMFRRAVEMDDGFALAHTGVAEATAILCMYYQSEREDLAAAGAAAQHALALDPDLAEAHVAWGAVVSLEGDLEEAERAFLRASQLDPRLFDARYLHGRACFQQSRFAEAARLFDEAQEIREDYQASFFAAQSVEALGDHDAAHDRYLHSAQVAERHMEFNPDDPRAATMLAVSLCRVGREEEGVQWAERALKIDPEDAGVRYNVACLFSVAGRTERALDCLEDARRVGFGNRAWVERDPDLDNLRALPRFQALLQEM